MLPPRQSPSILDKAMEQALLNVGFSESINSFTALRSYSHEFPMRTQRPTWLCVGFAPEVSEVIVESSARTGGVCVSAKCAGKVVGVKEYNRSDIAKASRADLDHLRFYGVLPTQQSGLEKTAELSAEFVDMRSTVKHLRYQLKANGHDVVDSMSNEELVAYVIEITGGFIHDVVEETK